MNGFLKPVSPAALVGETIVAFRHGHELCLVTQPYGVYTLVMESGREFVVSQALGEIAFSFVVVR